MYLHGSFTSQAGETVTVHIVTGGSKARTVEIGDGASGVWFSDDPVSIESSVNDSFDHILRSSATVRLQTESLMPELFCASCLDAAVSIYKGSERVFFGFIEPQAYSQAFISPADDIELSCIDTLSALQFLRYRNAGGPGVLYETLKAGAGQRTMSAILLEILQEAHTAAGATGETPLRVWYDGSKRLSHDAEPYDIFGQLELSELLMLGSEEDDVWTCETVLEEMLRYLNLHIAQWNGDYYLFSWETADWRSYRESISWHDLVGGTDKTETCVTTDITLDNAGSDDTKISIGETYNQILLECDRESMEELITNPMDSGSLTSPYSNRQLYMTEFSADGKWDPSFAAFYGMVKDVTIDHRNAPVYDKGVITDWYLQVMSNNQWRFPTPDDDDYVTANCRNNVGQLNVHDYLYRNIGAVILSLGKVEKRLDGKDNSPVPKVDMSSYLVVSVNGNRSDKQDTTRPNADTIKARIPVAIYEGNTSGGVYSPADPDTTNYIVISGSMVLTPYMEFSANDSDLRNNTEWITNGLVKRVPSRNDEKSRFYTQRYYRANSPNDMPVIHGSVHRSFMPFTGTGPEEYEFKYSAIGDSTDRISKIGVLACMLIIGDKCLVETGTQGQPSDFVWRTYKTRGQCADDDEYYAQSFTIGFDPKIGDKLIGVEYAIQNNIGFNLGIDATGTAIPVRMSDRLSGKIQFMILGPVNLIWDDVTRRHKTFFRPVKWGAKSVPLLAHVGSIMIKDFEMKIYSDNGLINNTDDTDLIYMSDTNEKFINRKDDIQFRISSALTSDECRRLGLPNSIKLSTPRDVTAGVGVVSIYDANGNETAKPEQLYVDSYYREYHLPRINMEHTVTDNAATVGLFRHYRHPALPGKAFYVLGISRSLIEGTATLTLKESWQ